jgi:acetyltransferase-like isoleucine patch superfamily enzyme
MAYIECIKNNSSYWLNDYINDRRLTVGEYTYFDTQITFGMWQPEDRVLIGKFCSLARDVTIFGGGEHFTTRATAYPLVLMFAQNRPERLVDGQSQGATIIGNDVWIGFGATIMSGVTIGNGAVIGAKAVVAKDVPDYAIAIGNPAKVIKYRFAPQTIARLNALSWWDWQLNKILANLDVLYQNPDNWAANLQFRKAHPNAPNYISIQQLKDRKII